MWLESRGPAEETSYSEASVRSADIWLGRGRGRLCGSGAVFSSPREGCAYSVVSCSCRIFALHCGLNVRMRHVGALLRGDVLKGKRVRSASAHTHTHTCICLSSKDTCDIYIPAISRHFKLHEVNTRIAIHTYTFIL